VTHKFKICLAGEPAVGKTSLIRRFVLDEFDDKYLETIGAKITKKVMVLDGPGGRSFQVTLTMWDIMGQKSVRHLLMDAYFEGADGILAVCDLTRESTLHDLRGWLLAIRRIAGDVPTLVVGNKVDLEDAIATPEATFLEFCHDLQAPYIFTSAKSGYNVSALFKRISMAVLERALRRERIA
jgi:small GTP-binding protein